MDNKIKHLYAIIESMIDDYLSADDPDCDESRDNISHFLYLAQDSYILVRWPDSQDLMGEDWFRDEAILDVDSKIGDSTYLIPIKRL